jgi:hypothetical protein
MTDLESHFAKIFDHKWLDGQCVESGCQSLLLKQLLEASSRVVQLIEGFPGYGTSTNAQGRLKDQPEWVEFYVLVKDLGKTSPEQST